MSKCSFKDCEVDILPHWKQHAAEGFIYWTDESTVNKAFVHRHNIDFGGDTRKGSNGRVDNSELSRAVLNELKELGATEGSIAIAKRLLVLASDKGSGAVGALDRLSVRLGENFAAKRPGPHERCKVCGRNASGDIVLTVSPQNELEQRRLQRQLEDEISQRKLGGLRGRE